MRLSVRRTRTPYAALSARAKNLTLGHEAVGIVHAVGSEVKQFKVGDRVVVGAITPDWGSQEAQNGYSSQSGGALAGWKFANVKDGVFAEYFHVNEADANMAIIPTERYVGAGRLLRRYALDRLSWRRARQHSDRRHGRDFRARTRGFDGDGRC